jgi:hypothetical protein
MTARQPGAQPVAHHVSASGQLAGQLLVVRGDVADVTGHRPRKVRSPVLHLRHAREVHVVADEVDGERPGGGALEGRAFGQRFGGGEHHPAGRVRAPQSDVRGHPSPSLSIADGAEEALGLRVHRGGVAPAHRRSPVVHDGERVLEEEERAFEGVGRALEGEGERRLREVAEMREQDGGQRALERASPAPRPQREVGYDDLRERREVGGR